MNELVRAHELLFVFTWRQIGVQYKQAILGIGWAVLSPLMSTVVAVNLVVLLLLMLLYGRAPGVTLLLLPVFLMLAVMIGFAISLWLSALNALYRDIGFMIPLALQAWMFLTPVIYPTGLVPPGWTWLLQLNPMTVVVQGARWAVLPDATPPDLLGLAILAAEFAVSFVGGVVTFHKIDAVLADRI